MGDLKGIELNSKKLGIDDDGDITIDGDKLQIASSGADISLDTGGFDKNLDDSVDNVQKLADAVDELSTGSSGDKVTLDTTNFDSNLDDTIDNVQKLADAVDDLQTGGTTDANRVAMESPRYSTDEVLTDKRWTDGKPIYRVTFYNADGTLPDNHETICDAKLTLKRDGENRWDTGSMYVDDDNKRYINIIDNDVTVELAGGYEADDYYVTVEYTKNDDDENSPVATLAVTGRAGIMPNYHTDEVLTERRWIDGKPIYRKVYIVEDLANKEYTDSGIRLTGADSVVNIEACDVTDDSNYRNHTVTADIIDDDKKLQYYFDSDADSDGYFIVEYTKLTDNETSKVASVEVDKDPTKVMIEAPSYSTEEVLTEKRWIDGKPIYRNVYHVASSEKDTVVKIGDGSEYATITSTMIIRIIDDSATEIISGDVWTYLRDDEVQYYTKVRDDDEEWYIALECTKTDDTVDSPVAIIESKVYNPEHQLELPGYNHTDIVTEKRWVDGRPIYRKVITGNIPDPSDDVSVDTGLENCDNAYIVNFQVQRGNGFTAGAAYSYYTNDDGELNSTCKTDGSEVRLYVPDDNDTFDGAFYIIIMEYTKTGDTASSPVATVGVRTNVVQTHLTEPSSQSVDANSIVDIDGLSAAITPSSISSKIRVEVRWTGETDNHAWDKLLGLKCNGTSIGLAGSAGNRTTGISQVLISYQDNNDTTMESSSFTYIHSPVSTEELTYQATLINSSSNDCTVYNQRTVTDDDDSTDERLTSTIILTEILGE